MPNWLPALEIHGIPVTSGATLVFPSSVPAAREYVREAKRRGEAAIAASSLPADSIASEVLWQRLPSIYAAEFEAEFNALVARNDIARVYCPVTVVHAHLTWMIQEHRTRVFLVNESHFYEAVNNHVALGQQAKTLKPFVQAVSGGDPFSTLQIAAVLRHAMGIFGETYSDKIAAMMGALADAPAGDVVEIGALFGRSAAVIAISSGFSELSRSILVVDPWSPSEATQEALSPFACRLIEETNWGAIAQAFTTNLLPYAGRGKFNYLAMTSTMAFDEYENKRSVFTEEFGDTQYSGGISFLHIDGNHDFDKVKADIRLWSSRLLPSAWIILDDYNWSHGDGPRRAADDFLQSQRDEIASAFFAGGALFVKLGPVRR